MELLTWVITILVLIGTALSAICQRHSKAQYYIKIFFFFWWYMGTAALVIPFAVFRPGDSINMGWWSFFVKYTFTSWFFGVSIKKQNTDELEYDGPCIVVCNHQTAFDQVVILYVWPSGRNTIMAKKSIKYAGTTGLACQLSGLIFVDRNNTEKARSQTTKECLDYLAEKKGKLWIYPEGTRGQNRDEHMLPFKKGAFHIAIKAQVPIIPVVMSGYKDTYSDKLQKFGKVDMTVTVLPQISTKGLTSDDVSSLSDRVRLAMLDTYYKTSPHVERPVSIETEDVPQSPDGLESGGGIQNKELPKEIETVSSKTCDSDQNENMQGEFHEKELTKSDSLDGIGTNTQKDHDSELGQTNGSLKLDESEAQNSVESSASEPKTSAESAADSDASKSTLLIDISEPANNKDNSLSLTPKTENDDSPSSQASSDSFVIVDSSRLDDEADSGKVDVSPPETSTREDIAQEESQSLSVEDIGENKVEQEQSTSQQDICAEDHPPPSSE